MFTFTTLVGASATLIASGVADKILRHYEKSNLAETLTTLTHVSALGYGAYFVIQLVKASAFVFL